MAEDGSGVEPNVESLDSIRTPGSRNQAFHTGWADEVQKALNDGLLPPGYYVLAEQHAGQYIADVLAQHAPAPPDLPPPPETVGGTAVAEAPPRVRRRQVIEPAARSRRRTLALRHVSGHRLIALIEMVSPANKDRSTHVEEFAVQVASAVPAGAC